jgi:hypothetical protein
MTNDETRMPNEARMTNAPMTKRGRPAADIGHSCFVIRDCFVIRTS